MIRYECRAAIVSLVLPNGSTAEPAIYFIDLPKEEERPLSKEEVFMTIIGNYWVAVGDRVVVADVVKVPASPEEPIELRPKRRVSAATERASPMRLQGSIVDAQHSNYEQFHKYYSATAKDPMWEFHFNATCGQQQGYLLRTDGSLLPYSHIPDYIARMSGNHMQPSHESSSQDVRSDDNMGIDPMKTIGAPPCYYEEEPSPRKKPGSRARSASVKVKKEVLASSPVKSPPSRRGRPPGSPNKKTAASKPTTPKRATSPRKPKSRAASPKKATTAKPVSTTATATASTSAATTAADRPPASASSQSKPHFGVAPISLQGISTKPVSAPAQGQGSPTRVTRSAARSAIAALPPTPSLPEQRLATDTATPAVAQPPPTNPYQVSNAQAIYPPAAPRPLPAYTPPASQPPAGPSSAPMSVEHAPMAAYPASISGYAAGFAQPRWAYHPWPAPMLVPATWFQRRPQPEDPVVKQEHEDQKMEEED